jgi:hypothetical protein
MPKYYVEMLIEFAGEIEAENAEQAEQLAWTSWGDTMDKEITYSGINDIVVDELEDEEDDEE